MTLPTLGVVVVAYYSAGHLRTNLPTVCAQMREGDDLVVVDNAHDAATAAAVRQVAPRARLVDPGANVGFAAGCHAGAGATSAGLLLLLNPDARPATGCLDALRAAAGVHLGWGAWQALVLLPGGEEVNTSGGVTHFLGFGWAGQQGCPVAAAPATDGLVSFPSGAALAVRREAWEALGGFDPSYFMYGEDLDLGLRLWLAGWEVGVVPGARVEHDYEFAKGPRKWYLLERNRLQTVLVAYPGALLALLAPALLAFELALLPVAAAGGWLGPKLRAQIAVLRALPRLPARRREVQATRRVSAAAFAAHLSDSLDSPFLGGAARIGVFVHAQSLYWAAVRRLLGR